MDSSRAWVDHKSTPVTTASYLQRSEQLSPDVRSALDVLAPRE